MTQVLIPSADEIVPALAKTGPHGRRWAHRDPLREVRQADRTRLLAVGATATGLSALVIAAQGVLVLVLP